MIDCPPQVQELRIEDALSIVDADDGRGRTAWQQADEVHATLSYEIVLPSSWDFYPTEGRLPASVTPPVDNVWYPVGAYFAPSATDDPFAAPMVTFVSSARFQGDVTAYSAGKATLDAAGSRLIQDRYVAPDIADFVSVRDTPTGCKAQVTRVLSYGGTHFMVLTEADGSVPVTDILKPAGLAMASFAPSRREALRSGEK